MRAFWVFDAIGYHKEPQAFLAVIAHDLAINGQAPILPGSALICEKFVERVAPLFVSLHLPLITSDSSLGGGDPSPTPLYLTSLSTSTTALAFPYNADSIMSSSSADQTALMKEVLEAVKTLQVNQAQLSSSVDAISGRVNVLAGMKQVRDVANTTPVDASPKKVEPLRVIDESRLPADAKIPESPSLPATQMPEEASPSDISHARKASTSTSRIILTYKPNQDICIL
jgi:hypothetical protein